MYVIKFIIILILIFITNINNDIIIEYRKETQIDEKDQPFLIGELLGASKYNNGYHLFDPIQNKVIKLDLNGDFVSDIITEGRGPSETLSMNSFFVNYNKERIIIPDGQNMRVLSTDFDGNEKSIMHYDPSDMNLPSEITNYKNHKYLFNFSIAPEQNMRLFKDNDKLFHFFDLEKGEHLYSFGKRQEILTILQYDGGAAVRTNFDVGNSLFTDENTMLFAPSIYGGKILVFRKKASDTWEQASIINSDQWEREPFIDLKEEKEIVNDELTDIDLEDIDSSREVSRTVGSMGYSLGLINYRSAGIYSLDEGYVHFVVSEHETEDSYYQELHAEIIDEELNLLGTDKIRRAEESQIFYRVDNTEEAETFLLTIREQKDYYSSIEEFSLAIER